VGRRWAGVGLAEEEWWAQAGRAEAGVCVCGHGGGCCFGGDFGDDDATLALGATWRRENPELAEKLQTDRVVRLPPTASGTNKQPTRAAPWRSKETLLALELSPDYRHECGICDRDYMLLIFFLSDSESLLGYFWVMPELTN
jgi:hypothetical protein